MNKFLIVGLGNPGLKYQNTRHNIGFEILDALANKNELIFETQKLADVCTLKVKGRSFVLIKPNTYMNLSGKAVRYWLQQENVEINNLLVVTDDINLDFGAIRIKAKGSHGGHNGLKHIQDLLNTNQYPRFRFGIGSQFPKGQQVDYVLGTWDEDEKKYLNERLEKALKAIISFGLAGIHHTMNEYNGK